MARHNPLPHNLQKPVQAVAAQPWFAKLARFGYAAKGIVYFIVGLLAAQVALGIGGRTTDTNGALETILTQPFGKFLLSLVTVGLVGYVLWRMVQAVLDPEHAGETMSAKRLTQRLGYACSAAAYAGLALTAMKLIWGAANNRADSTQDWTARFLEQPFGEWFVALAGVITVFIGVSYLNQAYRAKFQREFQLQQMSPIERTWTKRLGQFGIGARGIVFIIIGGFLIQAAFYSDANQAKGLGGALTSLTQQPFGYWLLGIIACGLIAYSLYSLIEARYRQFNRP